ncbi:hypothetical protein MN2019_02745 [Mycolicibacterium neoaurum]|uniref:EfeO-type cupredoxin-like domain-containing protein n=1 Tax=Mycolicibacterium bacteremicum TaxID=564198 RepID=A0A1W9YRP4_MYCBA|nr:hypothetical protein [Mycolicibacterium bacteremicum]ORA02758.1 hypothetical protein BST17_21770 [Mycolicibacterium bacteremicum]QVI28312.1 hypothetical protein MN2019_02745 [Mycolicibacterium neoaurum]
MRSCALAWLAGIATVGFVLAACGSSPQQTEGSSPENSPSSITGQSSATQPTAAATPVRDDSVVLDITISAGVVTPTNAELDAIVGEPITLRVDSDVADQLHVHSVPEHTFTIAAAQKQTFTFTVDVPGRVDVELHDLGSTIVTIQVRP